MRAMIYTGEKTLVLGDVIDPVPAEGEALIAVDSCGICGSDMHAWAGHDERRPAPLVLGHEVAGIAKSGQFAGKRVTVNPLATCGKCIHCQAGRDNLCAERQILSMPPRQGGFSAFVTIPEVNLVEVPDHVPMAKAALAEPLACGWHGVRLALAMRDGSLAELPCLVIGGGAIGVGAALALRAQGARDITIVEPNDGRRRAVALSTGFEVVSTDEGMAGQFGIVIDGVGYAQTRAAACRAVCAGGVIVHIGLGDRADGLDVRRITLQEISFIGTYTYTKQDFRETAAAIFDGRLGGLDWIEQRPLEEGPLAFADIAAGRALLPKIILTL